MPERSAATSSAYYLGQLTQDLPGKGIWLLLSSLWATIPQMYLFAIGWLVLDLALGLWKMRAAPEPVNVSGKGQDGILKFAIYLSMLALAEYAARNWALYADAVAEFPILGEWLAGALLLVTKGLPFVASFLITHTETTSCLENLQAIAKYRGRSYPALDILIIILRVRGDAIVQHFKGTGPLGSDDTKGDHDDHHERP